MLPNNIPYTVTCTISYNGGTTTSSNSSTIYSICRNTSRLAFDEPNINQSVIFPNPSQEIVFLKIELEDQEEAFVEIIDTKGNSLKKQNIRGFGKVHDFEISTEGIPNGLYLLKVNNTKGNQSHKMIINR